MILVTKVIYLLHFVIGDNSLFTILKNHSLLQLRVTTITQKNRDDKSVEFKVSLMPQVKLLPGAINEIMASVADKCPLTQSDRYGLLAAILDDSLSEEERRSVDRLLRSVLKGRVEVG